MKVARIFYAGMLVLAVSACAAGLFSKDGAPVLPPLDAGKGRVLFYRNSTSSAAYTPDVRLNGQSVGKADRRGVFFKDVVPGSYAVTTSITSKVINFYVGAGEKKYVRINNSFFGSNVYPELVESAKGESESSGLGLLGQGRK